MDCFTMLGVGNGFSGQVLNNNALLEVDGERTLIDCGITAMEGLAKQGLTFGEIDRIFITHLHFDHAGGLEAAALYSRYFSHKKITLILPAPIRSIAWENQLSGALDNAAEGLHQLGDYFHLLSPAEGEPFRLCGALQSSFIRTKHVGGKFSCGLYLGEKAFYTSDMVCDRELMEQLVNSGVEHILHDCQVAPGAVVHAGLNELLTYPEKVRGRLRLMHHTLGDPTEMENDTGLCFLRQQRAYPI